MIIARTDYRNKIYKYGDSYGHCYFYVDKCGDVGVSFALKGETFPDKDDPSWRVGLYNSWLGHTGKLPSGVKLVRDFNKEEEPKLKHIPASNESHLFKVGDIIHVKRGRTLAYTIKIGGHENDTYKSVTLFKSDGVSVKTRHSHAPTSKIIRESFFYSELKGCSLYLEDPVTPECPKDFVKPCKYIIWCPGSELPPRVVLEGRKQAKAIAISMAQRHGKEFHWCRLMGSAKPVTTITVTE